DIAERISSTGGPLIDITITTGDYVLSGDFPGSSPSRKGQIIVCTPERLEVMIRNPACADWFSSIRTVVVDEVHLLGDYKRGPCLEMLMTQVLAMSKGPRVVALSGTIGGVERIAEWFGSFGRRVEICKSDYRAPILDRTVVAVED